MRNEIWKSTLGGGRMIYICIACLPMLENPPRTSFYSDHWAFHPVDVRLAPLSRVAPIMVNSVPLNTRAVLFFSVTT